MNISPKSVKTSEHWKDWFSNAFDIYKKSFITSSAIYTLGALSIFLFDSFFYSLGGRTALIATSILLTIAGPLFFYYFVSLFIKYDENPGGLSAQYSKSGMKSCLLFFTIAAIIMATFKIGDYINPPESNEIQISLLEINFSQFTNSFSLFKISPVFSVLMLMIFMGFSGSDGMKMFIDAWQKNLSLFISSALILPPLIKAVGGLPYSYLFLPFLVPYLLCVLYVVFKHIFMDIEPRKRVKKKVSIPSFAS